MNKAKGVSLSLILLFVVLTAVASAAGTWPGWFKSSRTSGGSGGSGGTTYSVAEPAAIALLGAGLVSLGIYAKRKRSKKQ